jgi:hypothetical protein
LRFIVFLGLLYFGYIIPFNIKLVNMNIFNIFKVYYIQLLHYFGYIIPLKTVAEEIPKYISGSTGGQMIQR